MSDVHSSYFIDKRPAVPVKSLSGKNMEVKVKYEQVHHSVDTIGYRTLPIKSGYLPSNAFVAGSLIKEKIQADSAGKIRNAYLEITIAESGASSSVTLAPVWQWFNYIEFWAENGSGEQIQRLYNDVLMWNIISRCDNERLRQLLPNCNCDVEALFTQDVIPASGSRTYRLPLFGTFWDQVQPHLKSGMKDIEIRFQCTSGIVVSGSGTPSLSSINLIFEENVEHSGSMTDHLHIADHKHFNHVTNYLEFIQVSSNNVLTASTNTKISLENLVGKCAYLFFVVRSSTATNASNGRQNFYTLGDNSQIDLLDQSSKSLFANGVPLKGSFYRNIIWPDNLSNDVASRTAIYLMPFSRSVSAANKGIMNGYHQFDGSKYYLSITPDAAATSEVHTLDCTNPANDAGRYQLELGGDITNGLAFGANAAAIKAAIEALPFCSRHRITATASGALTTDATITLTSPDGSSIANRYNVDAIKVNENTLNDGGVYDIITSSVTTHGTNGFVNSGSTFTVDIYAAMYKRIVQQKDGRFSITNL